MQEQESGFLSAPAWGDSISQERQAKLNDLLQEWQKNKEDGLTPFAGKLLTGADVFWLAQKVLPSKLCLERANLAGAQLQGAWLSGIDLRGAELTGAYFEKANLAGAQLQGAKLTGANLRGTELIGVHLEEAVLDGVQLQDANLTGAHLAGAYLRRGTLNAQTRLINVVLDDKQHGAASLGDIRWGEVDLTQIDWNPVRQLGEERKAHQRRSNDGKDKNKQMRLAEYDKAVRANRQLAVVLEEQGLHEDAVRFIYHAQVLQKSVLWQKRKLGQCIFSWFLYLLAGYGYRMWRILIAYAIVITLAALAYFLVGMQGHGSSLNLQEAFLVSITAFHGRVFAEQFQFDTPQMWITAIEAVAGLVIEGVFIAMLAQRFFGK